MATAQYQRACDASAAVTIGNASLFAAASDEGCTLRVYDRAAPGLPISELDLATFLERDDADDLEADIEGVARISDRLYWIGSHGRSRKGKERKNRQRLFATVVKGEGAATVLEPIGRPYKQLLADLVAAPALAAFKLADATAPGKPPEAEGGFNIEGLAPTPDGHLLIGLRNPIPDGKALVVRLTNPAALVDGTATAATVELAGQLDLGNRGIRALEFLPSLSLYLILAGAFDDAGNFAMFAWNGAVSSPPTQLAIDIGGLNPEEMIVVSADAGAVTLHLLSDDGTDACKAAALEAKSFRGATVIVSLAAAGV